MNVIDVIKPFQLSVISNDIKGLILERNHSSVLNVVKYIHEGEVSKFSVLEKKLNS